MENLKHYLSLASLLSVAFGLFWYFSYDRQAQIAVTLATGAAYVLWGVIHHTIKKDFHWRVMVEYLAVAFFACVVVIFLIFRS